MKEWPWYGYLILGIIIFGFFYLLYYQPKSNELKDLQEKRVQAEEEVMRLQAKKQQLDKIEAELISLDKTLKELEAIIPLKKEISDILRRIQQLAFDSRLNILKFIPKGEVDKEFYSEWPISIEINGSYHNLAIFFDRLSHFSRLFNIENFQIKALRQQSDTSTISATYTAKTYIFQEESSTQEEKKGKRK